jgi:hypothetical protein
MKPTPLPEITFSELATDPRAVRLNKKGAEQCAFLFF